MAGMPAMQEQLPAMAMDGRYAGNAGALAGDGHGWPGCRCSGVADAPHLWVGNAGANSSVVAGGPVISYSGGHYRSLGGATAAALPARAHGARQAIGETDRVPCRDNRVRGVTAVQEVPPAHSTSMATTSVPEWRRSVRAAAVAAARKRQCRWPRHRCA